MNRRQLLKGIASGMAAAALGHLPKALEGTVSYAGKDATLGLDGWYMELRALKDPVFGEKHRRAMRLHFVRSVTDWTQIGFIDGGS